MVTNIKQAIVFNGSTKIIKWVFMSMVSVTLYGCGSSNYGTGNSNDLFDLSKSAILENFIDPPNEYRLVQYELNNSTLEKYPRYGIGGFMGFFFRELYQQGPNGRKAIGPLVDAAYRRGMEVWLADDYGYPSGMAGGKVVESNPEFEVRGLAVAKKNGNGTGRVSLDLPRGAERFVSATLFTISRDGSKRIFDGETRVESDRITSNAAPGNWELHAFFTVIRDRDVQAQSTMGQFEHAGRYTDLLNRDAIRKFLDYMHEEILSEIDDPSRKVRGFYTNEPNLMQLHWSFVDGAFACVSWNSLLPEKFEGMHGYDLMPRLSALFEGEDNASKRVRVHYHQTVAKLLTDSFALQIREWCHAQGIASSGHFLLNEYLAMHVAAYGDLMKFAAEFDIPALDIGIPNPDRFGSFPYEQTKLFSSIAAWKGRDSVICLLDPIIGGSGLLRLSPSIPLLLNSANWAFFHGANVLNSYLPLGPIDTPDSRATGYSPDEFRSFNEYVGRIALVMRGARRETSVGLYYPITRFQSYYRPSNQHWAKMRPDFVKFQKPWDKTVATLINADMDFNIIHPKAIEEGYLERGKLRIGNAAYRSLIIPQMEMLPKATVQMLKAFENAGGRLIWVDSVPTMGHYPVEDDYVSNALQGTAPVDADAIATILGNSYSDAFQLRFSPGPARLGVGRFYRANQRIYFLMNKTQDELEVRIEGLGSGQMTLLNPTNGQSTSVTPPHKMQIGALRSMLIIE